MSALPSSQDLCDTTGQDGMSWPDGLEHAHDKPFGALLRHAIDASGYESLAAFAGTVGISRSLVSAVLCGRTPPPLRKLPRMLGALTGIDAVQAADLRFAAYWEHTPLPMRQLLLSASK